MAATMKLFDLIIRKFEKEATPIGAIETWNVGWSSLHKNCIGYGEQFINVQGFPSKNAAEIFAKQLTDARKLLGDIGFDVRVYRQETYTNV